MASKKAVTDEKPKATKKFFFRRSESVMPDNYSKSTTSDSSNIDSKTNDPDCKKVIRRSSMICSEGFDKYTFDCHRKDIPSKSEGLDLDVVPLSEEMLHNQNLPMHENNIFACTQTLKPLSVEQTAVKKISFKPLAVLSVPSKNAPMPFKRVPEETIPANIPLSYKRVPEETVPIARTPIVDTSSGKSPVTTIPLSFSSAPQETGWAPNNLISKTSPIKLAPVKNSPVIPIKSAPVKNTPASPIKSAPVVPLRNTPLSLKQIPEKSQPASHVFSYSNVNDKSTPLSHKSVSDEFRPSRNTPLSFTRVPEQSISGNYISDEPIPIRNSPLSLKGESVSLRNIPSHFSHEFSMPSRNIPLSLQTVPEEPASLRESFSHKNLPDEPIPFRNSPLSLKPILTKHMSLLKRKPSNSDNAMIKRDSVVHPGRIDMQGSLFIDGRFQNPWPTWRPPTFANILKFGVTRNKSKVPPKQELDLVLPIVKQNFSKLSIPDDGIRATWIGHSTVLIQMHGLNILTDPIFSDRASPSQVVGPKRYRDPPCTIHDLPHINAVVISHSHYDHLDHSTITLLNARFGSELRWFVPLGLQTWMGEVGCENVVELDWWEENCVPEHSDTFFIFTPAQHWSKRAIGDDNKVLWGSWCILGPKYKFFFAGDTGYCDVFKQIGRVHGPFNLSAIPIGAYEPRWFMKYQHVNPEEAVKIHMDVKSERSLAIHWGTFSLANEYYLDPPLKLREGLDKYEIQPELFFTLKHGESRLIAQNNSVKKYPLSEKNTNVS